MSEELQQKAIKVYERLFSGHARNIESILAISLADLLPHLDEERVENIVKYGHGYLKQKAEAELEFRVSKATLEESKKASALHEKVASLTSGIATYILSQDRENKAEKSRIDNLNRWMFWLTVAGVAFAFFSLLISLLAWRFPQNPPERPKPPEVRASEDSTSLLHPRPEGPPAPAPVIGSPDSESIPVPLPADSKSKAETPRTETPSQAPAPPPQDAPKPDA